MYVDDLVTGSSSIEEFKDIKQNSVQLFRIGVSIYMSTNQMRLDWRVRVVTKVN